MKKTWLRLVSFAAPLLATATAFAQESNANDVGKFAALEGIARNPSASDKLFTPMIIGLALIESLAIYALVIAIMLIGNIPAAGG